MIDEQKVLVKQKAVLTRSKSNLVSSVDALKSDLEKQIKYFSQDVKSSQEAFFDQVEEECNSFFREKIDAYSDRVNEVDQLINDLNITESDESVRSALEKRDYLNSCAVVLNEYYNILLDVSELYFIELAITRKTTTFPLFRKEMKKMDFYKLTLLKLESKKMSGLEEGSNIWLSTLMHGWVRSIKLPYLIYNAVQRANALHKFSLRYYILMETFINLTQSNNDEIVETLKGVVKEREDSLYSRKLLAEESLNKVYEDLQSRIESERLKCINFEDAINAEMAQKNEELEGLEKELEVVDLELSEVTDKLSLILDNLSKAFREIRDRFLNPSNQDKSYNLPTNLIYGFSDTRNTYLSLVGGLWIYNDRNLANASILSIIFQLRNYMKWGSINFNVFDILMAGFLTKMMFKNNCDISISSMKEDQESCIDILHDTLIRRNAVITASHEDVHSYNTYQSSIDAPTMSFEVLVIFQEEVSNLNEKIVQIMSRGSQLGILVLVLLRGELITENTFKTYERYVENIVTLTKGGISVEDPRIFGQKYDKIIPPTPNTR